MRDKEFNDFVSELQSEIDNYKNDTLKLSKNQIYDNSYEIQAMESLCGYLMNDGQKYRRSDFPKDKILETFYWRFMKTDYDLTRDDLSDFFYFEIQDKRKIQRKLKNQEEMS